jgi:hypothetical protein
LAAGLNVHLWGGDLALRSTRRRAALYFHRPGWLVRADGGVAPVANCDHGDSKLEMRFRTRLYGEAVLPGPEGRWQASRSMGRCEVHSGARAVASCRARRGAADAVLDNHLAAPNGNRLAREATHRRLGRPSPGVVSFELTQLDDLEKWKHYAGQSPTSNG